VTVRVTVRSEMRDERKMKEKKVSERRFSKGWPRVVHGYVGRENERERKRVTVTSERESDSERSEMRDERAL